MLTRNPNFSGFLIALILDNTVPGLWIFLFQGVKLSLQLHKFSFLIFNEHNVQFGEKKIEGGGGYIKKSLFINLIIDQTVDNGQVFLSIIYHEQVGTLIYNSKSSETIIIMAYLRLWFKKMIIIFKKVTCHCLK